MVEIDLSNWMKYGDQALIQKDALRLVMGWELCKRLEDVEAHRDSGSHDERAQRFAKSIVDVLATGMNRKELSQLALEVLRELERRNQETPRPADPRHLEAAVARIGLQATGERDGEKDLPSRAAYVPEYDVETLPKLELVTGEQVNLKLKENRSTGYIWQLDGAVQNLSLVDVIRNDCENKLGPNKEPAIGGVNGITYTVQALFEGEAELIFTLRRPWEAAVIAKQFRVPVSIRKFTEC